MAKIKFQPGDVFLFEEGVSVGMVLKKGALLITGSGGREGLRLEKVAKIPSDAEPQSRHALIPFEATFALRAVRVATDITKGGDE